MIRGTTAQFKFKLPYSKDELEWIKIKFWQPQNPTLVPITKIYSHCSQSGPNEICVSLTEEESAAFSDKYKGKVQFRAKPKKEGGLVFGCPPQLFTVYPMLDELIEEDPNVVPTDTE